MTTRADVVAEARTWLGTPFHWQASVKGVGCDCKGLVWGVARALGLAEALSPFAGVADYRIVPVALLKRGMAETFRRADAPEAGDVLLMRLGGQVQHLGIHSGAGLIHTYGAGPKQVIETPLKVALRAWPMDSAWRFASLEG